MRVLVTGDRNYRDFSRTLFELSYVDDNYGKEHITLVHGDARGADTLADCGAQFYGWDIERYPADWKKNGRAAGPIRNQEMLNTGIDLCVAFHDDLGASRGTRDMVERCEHAGVRVIIVGKDTR